MHPTLIASGGETGHVTDYATTERNNRAIAIKTVLQQSGEYLIQHSQRLILLAIGQDYRLTTQSIQCGKCSFEIQWCDRSVTDH